MKWIMIFLGVLAAYSLITGNTGGARESASKYQQVFKQQKLEQSKKDKE